MQITNETTQKNRREDLFKSDGVWQLMRSPKGAALDLKEATLNRRNSSTTKKSLSEWGDVMYEVLSHKLIQVSPSQICVDLRLIELAQIMVKVLPNSF